MPRGFHGNSLGAHALALVSLCMGASWLALAPTCTSAAEAVLVIHGGAGVGPRSGLTKAREAAVRAGLTEALRAGHAVLRQRGAAVDAVAAALVILEDSPFFNAGRGAALDEAGSAELDAAIMDGHTLAAGAVAGVRHTRNPVLLARAVMERSGHVMMIGEGAEIFGASLGLEQVDPAWFITDERREDLRRARRDGRDSLRADPLPRGTVGAVALDAAGHLAAATSTGGLTNKRVGRVGDSPIIGAGTYADARCAVSATGSGEYFIRIGVARDIGARLDYAGEDIDRAARRSVRSVEELGGEGGVIALDRKGRYAMPFTGEGMYRGRISRDGRISISVYRD